MFKRNNRNKNRNIRCKWKISLLPNQVEVDNPEYFEGLSKVVGVYIYEDTPIGLGKITILGELKDYFDEEGNKIEIIDDWKDIYNVKWENNLTQIETFK